MTIVTLNARNDIPVPGLGALSAHSGDQDGYLRLQLEQAGRVAWISDTLRLSPEPTLEHSTSRVADYLATAWAEGNVVAILGRESSILLELVSGAIAATFPLEFVRKEALEQAGLEISADRRFLLITSTKRLWVVGRDLQAVLCYEPRFLLAGLPHVNDHEMIVPEYDFDSEQEVVTQVLPLPP
jgi:hypothetical protein